MSIGDNLSRVEQQYVAKKDNKNTWRILNLWHPTLKNFSSGEEDVPDEHPAVTVLTEGAFIALVKAAVQEGVIQNAVTSVETNHDECASKIAYDELIGVNNQILKQNDERASEIIRLSKENDNLKQEKPRSEAFETTKLVVDSLVRLAGMSNIKDEKNKL